MLEHIFVNGCSFNTPNPKANIELFVGSILSDHYHYKLTNFARGGRGNHRIAVTTKLYFEQNPQRKADTIAVIEWTQSGRSDYLTNDHWKPMQGYSSTWRTFHTRDMIANMPGLDDAENESIQILNHIIDLQNYFNLNGIEYIMYFGLNNTVTDSKDSKTLLSMIDTSKFFQMDTSHYQYCHDNNHYVSNKDYHPSQQGHRAWADKLVKYIDDTRRT